MSRNEYSKSLVINGKSFSTVIIDQHYKIAHPKITDEIILNLLQIIDGAKLEPDAIRGDFKYFKIDPLYLLEKPYRLIFLLCLGDDYLGVINAFRVKGDQNEK